jgi:hypothetical protein
MMKTFSDQQVIVRLKQRVRSTSATKVAASIGVTAGYISDVLKTRRRLTETIGNGIGFEVEEEQPPVRKWKLKGDSQ